MLNYTDTLEEKIRSSVRQIGGGNIDSFRSHLYRDKSGVQLVWREALRDPVTNTWTISHCSAIEDMREDGAIEIDPNYRYGLCFFDALYKVAQLEANPDLFALENVVQDVPDFITAPHHRAQAEAIGIPYDNQGNPIPAVNGMIISSGRYNADARKIAARSKNNVQVDKNQQAVMEGVIPTAMLPSVPQTQNSMTIRDNAALTSQFNGYEKVVGNQLDKMADAAHEGWLSSDGKILMALGTASASGYTGGIIAFGAGVPALAAILIVGSMLGTVGTAVQLIFEYKHINMPLLKYKNGQKRLQEIANDFPEGHKMRQDIMRFRDEVHLTYHVARAYYAFNDAAKGGRLSRWRLTKALAKLDQAYDQLQIPHEQRRAFNHTINNQDYRVINIMSEHLNQRANNITRALNAEKEHIAVNASQLQGPS